MAAREPKLPQVLNTYYTMDKVMSSPVESHCNFLAKEGGEVVPSFNVKWGLCYDNHLQCSSTGSRLKIPQKQEQKISRYVIWQNLVLPEDFEL